MARGKKLKAKTWYTILAPKYFKEKPLGITPAADAKQLINRVVEISAMLVTDDYNKYYMKYKFRINRVDGDKAYTAFDGLECLQDYISRLVRKRTRRIDAVQDVKTKDGVLLRVKTITISNRRIKSSIMKAIRDFVKEVIEQEVTNSRLDEFLKKVNNDEIKKKIIEEGSKIYPIRFFEIRRIDVLTKDTSY